MQPAAATTATKPERSTASPRPAGSESAGTPATVKQIRFVASLMRRAGETPDDAEIGRMDHQQVQAEIQRCTAAAADAPTPAAGAAPVDREAILRQQRASRIEWDARTKAKRLEREAEDEEQRAAELELRRPQFSWTRIKGESDVKGGGGHGWVEASAGSGVGADGGSPEGERSRRRRRGGWGGGLGARAAVEREPETGRGSAASARRVA